MRAEVRTFKSGLKYEKMQIKICGIKYRENLQEVIKLNPDLIGFNFFPSSPRFIGNNLNPADFAVIPIHIRKVGIFVNQDEHEVSVIHQEYGLEFVQLHGNENIEICRKLNSEGIKIIKAFGVHEKFDFLLLADYAPFCDYFLFDTLSFNFGGSGKRFNWEILNKYDSGHPFFLSGGIDPDDAERIVALSFSSMAGVDVNSKFELEPGLKDTGLLNKFMISIRNSNG